MQHTNIQQAKSQLSKLVELACGGEEIVICKAGKPMAKLVQYPQSQKSQTKQPDRVPGAWKGRVEIADDFDDLPEALVAFFRGEAY